MPASQAGRRGFESRLPLQNPSESVVYSPRFCCAKSLTPFDSKRESRPALVADVCSTRLRSWARDLQIASTIASYSVGSPPQGSLIFRGTCRSGGTPSACTTFAMAALPGSSMLTTRSKLPMSIPRTSCGVCLLASMPKTACKVWTAFLVSFLFCGLMPAETIRAVGEDTLESRLCEVLDPQAPARVPGAHEAKTAAVPPVLPAVDRHRPTEPVRLLVIHPARLAVLLGDLDSPYKAMNDPTSAGYAWRAAHGRGAIADSQL